MSLAARIRNASKALFGPAEPNRRSFDGATGGRRAGGFERFGPINSEVSAAGPRLMERARSKFANNPLVRNGVENLATALTGSGIQANSGHPDSNIRELLDTAFIEWAPGADADMRTDWFGLQNLIAQTMIVDGESFIQLIPSRDGLKLRLIPAEQVDWSLTRELAGDARIVNGVEFNSDGERIAYHILPVSPTSIYPTYGEPIRVAADQILHVFKPIAAGQVRGVSWLAPILLQSNEFDQLVDALLVGVKVAAMHAGFVIDPNANGTVAFDPEDSEGLANASLEPDVMRVLPAGTDVRFSTPQQANEVSAFLRLNLQMLAAGLGIPEHMLSGDLSNANYSSIRAGLLPFRARVEQIQYGVLVPQFLRPVWQRFVALSVLSGATEAPGYESERAAYEAVEWIPPRHMQVDPLKDTQAVKEQLGMGLMSRRQAVAEQGWNVETLDAEIAADRERETALGLDFSTARESSDD
ncbi:MAG: phage portal protein [Pseudomonadota bacterium]